MKPINLFILAIFLSTFVITAIGQNDSGKLSRKQRKAEKEKLKKEKEEKENAQWAVLQSIAKNKRFVAQLDHISDMKTGQMITLNSRLNFIAVSGDKVVIQFETNTYLANNGLGGLTIDGTINDYKYTPPKNDNKPIVISFNVTSKQAFRGYNVSISVSKGGITNVSMGATPNIYGTFLTPEDANINMGVNMFY